jgi:assimilatory nitrate reductase catalytic subunit
VGCGVIIESRAGVITHVRGDPDHPANRGRLCTKGSTLHLTAAPHLQQQARAWQPLRRAQRGQPLAPVAWDAALDETAQRLASTVQQHGPDAVGFYISGQLLTEDYYVFNKLAKGLVGTNNIDSNSRLCMSSAVAGYKASLGADAPPACYDDLAHAGTVFITGANPAWAHPVLYRRLEDARRANPALKLIVADPRGTETAQDASLHLPLQPGTDVALMHGMLHVMLWEGWCDNDFINAHTQGFAALRERVREFTPAHTASVCGLQPEQITTAARWFAGVQPDGTRTPTLSLYCQGLNQSSSGTDKNSSLINLHLACGQIGRPGAGPLSLTGQPNAMGGREVGGMANLQSGHRDLANPDHRAEVAALWGVKQVAAQPGKAALEMFEAAADGQIRALWIACTNPAQSLPDQAMVRRALQRCEFVVLQEAYAHTATAAYADLLLPATTWGEKEGTVTNSERCISRVRAAVPAWGQARHDWAIVVDVAQRLESLLPDVSVDGSPKRTLFDYTTPEAIWCEHRESTRGRDLDITGLSYAALEAAPQAWPCPEGHTQGQARLYTDHRFATPDGRARFVAPAWRPVAEARDARFPMALGTGRLRDQWHGMSRTGTLARLMAHASEPAVQVHPQTLARQGWHEGQLMRVQSRRGALVLPLQADASVGLAQAFIAMHWGSEVLGGTGSLGVNGLTTGARCPSSRQPELKHAAVRLHPAALPWGLVAAAWLPADQWWAQREALRPWMQQLIYASCVPFGREPGEQIGLLWRSAHDRPASSDLIAALQAALGLKDTQVLRYDDARGGQHRAMRQGTDGTMQGFLLAGHVAAHAWALDLLQRRGPARGAGSALLAASATAPAGQQAMARSPQVCACHDVSQAAITACAMAASGDAASRLTQVQRQLRCGTECGSCLPAVKALVQTQITGLCDSAQAS